MAEDFLPPEKQPAPRWALVAIPIIVLLGAACICASLALSAAGGLARVLQIPLGWFSGDPATEMSLAAVLEERETASFRLGEECSFLTIDGSIVRSEPDAGSGGFAQQMPRADAVAEVLASVRGDLYLIREGEIELESGQAVSSQVLGDDQVHISFTDDETTGEGHATRSVDGLVQADELRASYYSYSSTSAVIEGQGYEEAVTILADFTCPLEWVTTP